MYKSLVIFLIFFSLLSFSQDNNYFDFIHQNQIQYDVVEIDVANPDLNMLTSIEYLKMHGGSWKGIDKINALIKMEAETINSKEFAVRFVKEYNAALKKTLLEWYDECLRDNNYQDPTDCGQYMDYNDVYTAENVNAHFTVLSLNDHILIGGMNVTFVAARENYLNRSIDLAFQNLHYYDLNKGIEIAPSTILQKKTKSSFIKLAKSKVPDHLKLIADSLDFENGLPLFIGGSFYYFVYGNIEADTDDQVVIQIRFSFEEAIPFLDPNGPFSSYIALKKESANYTGLTYNETRYYNNYFAKEVSNLESIDKLLESLNGEQFKDQHALINTGPHQAEILVEFNHKGAISNYKYQIPEENLVDDSVAFIYYPNGILKEIQSYEIKIFENRELEDEIEKMAIDEVYAFDEKQNLVQKSKFGSLNSSAYSDEVEIEYYTYFGDHVIGDYGNITSCSMGYEYGNTKYLVIEGNLEELNEFDYLPTTEYKLERVNNETRLLCKHGDRERYKWRYFSQDGRIEYYQEDSDNSRINLSYDDRGNLITSTKYRISRNGLILDSKVEAEYDKQNRPITYTYYVYNQDETVNNSRTYLFEWDSQ